VVDWMKERTPWALKRLNPSSAPPRGAIVRNAAQGEGVILTAPQRERERERREREGDGTKEQERTSRR